MDGTRFRDAEGRPPVRSRHPTHPAEFAALDSTGLRERFLVEELFVPGEVRLVYSHHDRIVLGGAVPAGRPLALDAPDQLRAGHFCDRRELAIACLAGTGSVTVDGQPYPLSGGDLLYAGRGAGGIVLAGTDARFYLVSAPAHATHPTTLVRRDDALAVHLGEPEHANVRTVRRYLHADGAASDQLVVGITELARGSVWNTMPCHTHERRTEVYLYFGLGAGDRIVHLAGRPDATRSLVVANEQAVISPPWSVHCGAGTASYSFVWAMAGENTAFDDMDVVSTVDLR
jgi:4-deoxy-L-threo-5-hexosulose-uronate ketol-isomerase